MYFKKIFILLFLILLTTHVSANAPRSTGKYKNWESFVAETDKGKICFAQSVPVLQAPSAISSGESKLFITFRPYEKIKDEISITSGHPYEAIHLDHNQFVKLFYLFFARKFCMATRHKGRTKFYKSNEKSHRLNY